MKTIFQAMTAVALLAVSASCTCDRDSKEQAVIVPESQTVCPVETKAEAPAEAKPVVCPAETKTEEPEKACPAVEVPIAPAPAAAVVENTAPEKKESAPAASDLIGTWSPEKVAGADKIANDGRPAKLIFNADGNLYGYSGMNNIRSSYTVGESGKIALKAFVSTMKAGPDDVAAFEKAFLAALHKVVAFKVIDGRLFLYDADNNELIVLQKQSVKAD